MRLRPLRREDDRAAAARRFHPVVELHASWFVLNPLQGCPKRCGYCFMGPWSQTGARPEPVASVAATVDAVLARPDFTPTIPLCLLTHSDAMATAEIRAVFLDLVRELRRRQIDNPICFV